MTETTRWPGTGSSEQVLRSSGEADPERPVEVRLRRFPYPFRSMLAVSSDTDRTTIDTFRTLHRFLNTEQDTVMGPGVGLDIADSLWVFKGNERGDMALLSSFDNDTPEWYADELAAYVGAGWVDTLHTYGNYTSASEVSKFERRHAERAIDELVARGLALTVWVNHGSRTNIQNFGNGGTQRGDDPSSVAYHTDLLLDYGVRFAWNHQDGDTAGVGSPLAPLALGDGRRIWGFPRYTAATAGAGTAVIISHSEFFRDRPKLLSSLREGKSGTMLWWPPLLDAQLSAAVLDKLVADGAYCIAAQHLGDLSGGDRFEPVAVETFRRLRRYQDEGEILVARVSRLLEYARAAEHVRFDIRGNARQLYIDITAVADPVLGTFVPSLEQVRGLTFYVPDPTTTFLLLDGVAIRNAELERSPSDGTAASIGVRWFEPDTTDYVALYRATARASAPSAAPARSGFTRLAPYEAEELNETAAAADLGEFGLAHPLRSRYSPTNRSLIPLIFDGLEIGPDDVFLDLGSGKGRMLLVAACHSFRRVIGVDIAEPLNDVARRNVDHNAGRLSCTEIDVITGDLADWQTPDAVTTVYFFNSLRGELLTKALDSIVASLDRVPRTLRFISLYPAEARAIEATGRFEPIRERRFGEKPLETILYYESRPARSEA